MAWIVLVHLAASTPPARASRAEAASTRRRRVSRLRAFVDALALALPCDVCRQHFATRRGAAGGLDEAIAGGATREAMMAAVLALRHSISPDEAITKADQEAFAQRTAPTASASMWMLVMACAFEWDIEQRAAAPRPRDTGDHPQQVQAEDTFVRVLKAVAAVWPAATPQAVDVMQREADTLFRAPRGEGMPREDMVAFPTATAVYAWAQRVTVHDNFQSGDIPAWAACRDWFVATDGAAPRARDCPSCRPQRRRPPTRTIWLRPDIMTAGLLFILVSLALVLLSVFTWRRMQRSRT